MKIIRLWKQYFPVVGETIELVICDAFGHTIHATVNDDLVVRFYPILKEGNSLMILNFNVRPSVGAYQTTKHPYKIVFSSKTRVLVSELLPCQLTGFHPVAFSDILDEVVRFSSLDIISVNGKDIHKCPYSSGINDQRVTIILWGDNAVVVSDVLHYSINRAWICVVRFGKISVCQCKHYILYNTEERSVSNVCNISDIAFNPDMDKVESFWKLLPEVDITLEHMELKPLCLVSDIADKIDFFVDTSTKTITQVLDTTQVQMYIITCTIAEIDTDKGWYDMSCKVCEKEVLNVSTDWCAGHADNLNIQKHYYCMNCVTYSPKHDIRYMLNLVVLDNTGVNNFILLDNLAQQLCGLPCIELTGGNTAEIQGRPLPAVLTKLVGKTYFFKINIDVPNYLYKHEPFKILNIITCTDMIYELQVNHSPMGSTSKLYGSLNHVLCNSITPAKRHGSPYLLEDANSLEMNSVTKGSCSMNCVKRRPCSVRIQRMKSHKLG
ncbi:hypothetical protein N665_0403s0002 [Sinapis alba]|nr:hypothetical protein N665_0403s0002 [Sinapis alba]